MCPEAIWIIFEDIKRTKRGIGTNNNEFDSLLQEELNEPNVI